ncbi:hypothetical protein ACNBFH_004432 [Salmonella enterica subsp. enterica serovar Bareilly]
MTYRKDPQKRLAELLNNALNKGHTHAVIITDRLEMTGSDQRWLACWVAWHVAQGAVLVNIREHLASLPRVTC